VRVAGSTEAMTTDTIFDVESMTKVLATTTMAMRLVKAGKLSLLDRVAKYLPDFSANAKGSVLVRDLLRYSSGLPVDNQKVDTDDVAAIWAFMLETPLEYAIGSSVEYSDLGFRILGKLLETVAGETLDSYCKREIWGQLGPAAARSACGRVRCAARCRTIRTGSSAASSAATGCSPRHATSPSSAR
jgi:CubicO group peptidase (beta-lactamase class C family)